MREKILVVDGRATVFRCDGQRGERSWLRLSLQLACSTSCYDAGMSQVATQRELRNGARAVDLMIAAVACSVELPLYTRNPGDFAALDGLVDVIAI